MLFVSDLPLATAFDRRKMLLYSAYFCLACFGVVHTHTHFAAVLKAAEINFGLKLLDVRSKLFA